MKNSIINISNDKKRTIKKVAAVVLPLIGAIGLIVVGCRKTAIEKYDLGDVSQE